MTDLPL